MIDYDILFRDPDDAAVDMALSSFTVNSGGYDIFARCHKPVLNAQDEKRPAIIVIHGFPGNDQYLDLAQNLRRAGFVCITYTARGAWGSHGPYRFDTLLDDALAVLEHVKKNADAFSVDVDQIFYFGQSVGGLVTTRALAGGAGVAGAIIVAPCDMPEVHDSYRDVFDNLCKNASPFLNFGEGMDASVLYEYLSAKGAAWKFPKLGREVDPKYPVLLIAGTRDAVCPIAVHAEPLVDALRDAGLDCEYDILDTDHNIQNKRIEFTKIIYRWLSEHSNF